MMGVSTSGLAKNVDRVPDTGFALDVWARVSLVGLEILTVEALDVLAGIEIYLKCEGVGRVAPMT